jgi:hypothetical protein
LADLSVKKHRLAVDQARGCAILPAQAAPAPIAARMGEACRHDAGDTGAERVTQKPAGATRHK